MATSETRDRSRKTGSSKPSKAPARSKSPAAKKPVAKKAAAKKVGTAVRSAKKPSTAAALPKTTRLRTKPPKAVDPNERLRSVVLDALDNLKAKDVQEIDVRGKSSIADLLVVASGTSSRHVKSIADEVVKKAKHAGQPPIGVEGQREGEWVLVDLGDVIVHVMLPRTREFYGLERLWTVGDAAPAALAG